MIKTYHNFKQWVKKHYPDIMITPVYGTGAYTLSKALNDVDMFLYNIQQLPSGQYIVWPGLTPEQVMEQYKSIVQNGVPTRPEQAIPSTFTSFEAWVTKHQLKPLHRTHVTAMTAAEVLHDDSLEHVKRNWYLYELTQLVLVRVQSRRRSNEGVVHYTTCYACSVRFHRKWFDCYSNQNIEQWICIEEAVVLAEVCNYATIVRAGYSSMC